MANLDVSMDYSSLQGIAKQISAKKTEFDILSKNLTELLENLSSKWEGKAKAEFSDSLKSLKSQLKTVSGVLANYSKELDSVVSDEQQTDLMIRFRMPSLRF